MPIGQINRVWVALEDAGPWTERPGSAAVDRDLPRTREQDERTLFATRPHRQHLARRDAPDREVHELPAGSRRRDIHEHPAAIGGNRLRSNQ